MKDVGEVMAVAEGINDYGFLVVLAAFYLVITAVMMVTMFKWFKNIIDKVIAQQAEFKPVMEAIREVGNLMERIAEGLRPETMLRIRNLTGFAFDLSVEQVCRLIKKVREENHIDNREATAEKIRKSLTVMHEDRNSRFDSFSFRGERLSRYCNEEWVEKVAVVVEGEIYHEDGVNNGRAYTNVKLAYDEIKTDFYNRLNG